MHSISTQYALSSFKLLAAASDVHITVHFATMLYFEYRLHINNKHNNNINFADISESEIVKGVVSKYNTP